MVVSRAGGRCSLEARRAFAFFCGVCGIGGGSARCMKGAGVSLRLIIVGAARLGRRKDAHAPDGHSRLEQGALLQRD